MTSKITPNTNVGGGLRPIGSSSMGGTKRSRNNDGYDDADNDAYLPSVKK